MMKDKPGSPDFSELRRQAEERFEAEPPKIDQPQGVVEKLLHELQVPQIELKSQNEELRSALESKTLVPGFDSTSKRTSSTHLSPPKVRGPA